MDVLWFRKNGKVSKEDDILNFVNELLVNLNAEDKVLVSTDKINRYATKTLENCRISIFKNLEENTDEVNTKEVRKFKREVVEILEKL